MVASVRPFQTKCRKGFSWSQNLHQRGRKSGCFCGPRVPVARTCDYEKVKPIKGAPVYQKGCTSENGQNGFYWRGFPSWESQPHILSILYDHHCIADRFLNPPFPKPKFNHIGCHFIEFLLVETESNFPLTNNNV